MTTTQLIDVKKVLKAFLVFAFLSAFSTVHGQALPNLELTLSSEQANWTKDQPAVVSIKIKNSSSERAKIPSGLHFYLDNETSGNQGMKKGAYYAPFSLKKKYLLNVRHCQSDLDEKNVRRKGPAVIITRDTSDVYLNGNEGKEFQIDLAGLCWAHQISSVYPMSNLFSEAGPGNSMLYFSIRFVTGTEVYSGTRIPISKAIESNKLLINIR